jgi:hypothetical protein
MTAPTHDVPGQRSRPQHGPDRTEGNARLTALTGMVLLVLFAAEIVTEILGVRTVLTTHVVIGYLLAPPAAPAGAWSSTTAAIRITSDAAPRPRTCASWVPSSSC